MIAIDHVQIAIPTGGEPAARAFFVGLLGMAEECKPAALAARGGCWFRAGGVHLHCGVESPFQPQRKAHVAFRIDAIDDLAKFTAAGISVKWDDTVEGCRRFYVDDPFGNRLEFIKAVQGFPNGCSRLSVRPKRRRTPRNGRPAARKSGSVKRMSFALFNNAASATR